MGEGRWPMRGSLYQGFRLRWRNGQGLAERGNKEAIAGEVLPTRSLGGQLERGDSRLPNTRLSFPVLIRGRESLQFQCLYTFMFLLLHHESNYKAPDGRLNQQIFVNSSEMKSYSPRSKNIDRESWKMDDLGNLWWACGVRIRATDYVGSNARHYKHSERNTATNQIESHWTSPNTTDLLLLSFLWIKWLYFKGYPLVWR